jgi:hypothetical protein
LSQGHHLRHPTKRPKSIKDECHDSNKIAKSSTSRAKRNEILTSAHTSPQTSVDAAIAEQVYDDDESAKVSQAKSRRCFPKTSDAKTQTSRRSIKSEKSTKRLQIKDNDPHNQVKDKNKKCNAADHDKVRQ